MTLLVEKHKFKDGIPGLGTVIFIDQLLDTATRSTGDIHVKAVSSIKDIDDYAMDKVNDMTLMILNEKQ